MILGYIAIGYFLSNSFLLLYTVIFMTLYEEGREEIKEISLIDLMRVVTRFILYGTPLFLIFAYKEGK